MSWGGSEKNLTDSHYMVLPQTIRYDKQKLVKKTDRQTDKDKKQTNSHADKDRRT